MNGSGNRIPTRWNPKRIPELVEIQGGKPLDAFETNDVDKVSSTLLYNGLENKDGTWCIQEVNSSSGVSLRYATAVNNSTYGSYNAAWTDRATLTYDLFSIAF
jgi:hypothetical protein